jgi:hypothetical protein
MSQEMRANWLDIAVSGIAEVSDSLEILLSCPPFWKDRQRQIDLNSIHFCYRVEIFNAKGP